jgi:8-oxo-dGTP pyrophosphatase MutT (NUDIX family)
LADLAGAVRAADHVLNATTYRMAAGLFHRAQDNPALQQQIQESSPEYRSAEFLLCVDRHGDPVRVQERVLATFEAARAADADLGAWFQAAKLPDGTPTLLIARWLAHAAGFRHRAVHLFLDHPKLPDHVVLQLRGFDKAEAPGCFDLPAAGHVSGLDSVEDALAKELHEELGLELGALDALQLVGGYAFADGHNAEYRFVYRARLHGEDLLRLQGNADEVAAVAVFPMAMVWEMLSTQPALVASGLNGFLARFDGGEA